MNDLIKDITPSELQQISTRITDGVGNIIEQSKRTIAVYLNSEVYRITKPLSGVVCFSSPARPEISFSFYISAAEKSYICSQ